jgi:hypothetical protein
LQVQRSQRQLFDLFPLISVPQATCLPAAQWVLKAHSPTRVGHTFAACL